MILYFLSSNKNDIDIKPLIPTNTYTIFAKIFVLPPNIVATRSSSNNPTISQFIAPIKLVLGQSFLLFPYSHPFFIQIFFPFLLFLYGINVYI